MTIGKLRICPVNYFDLATLTDTPPMLAGSPVTNAQLSGRDLVAQSTGVSTQSIQGHFGGNGYLADSLFFFRHTAHGGLLRYLIFNSVNCTGGNLFLYSEDMVQAPWAKLAAAPSALSVTAPDGVSPMRKLVEDTSTGLHAVGQAVGATSGQPYTVSVYAQSAERTAIWFLIQDVSANNVFCRVNLATGAITSLATGGGSPPTAVSATAVSTPNPDGTTTWRAEIRFTSSTTSQWSGFVLIDGSGSSSYTGNGTSGVYLWGFMFSRTAVSVPYSMTTSAAEPDDGTYAIYDSGWLEVYQLVSLGNMEWMGNAPLGFSTTDMLASESAFCLYHPATGITGFRLTFTRCQYHYWQFGRIFIGKYVEAPYNPKLGMNYGWVSSTVQTRTKGATLRTNPGERWRELKVDMFYLDETQRPIWRDLAGQISLEKDVAVSVFPGYGGRKERDFVFNAQMSQHNPFGWTGQTMNETSYQFTEE